MSDIFDAMARNAGEYDGRTFISDQHTSLTRAGLSARVADYASSLAPLPKCVGLLGENGVDWVIAQLAGWMAGKLVVPLPMFFSPEQLGHVVSDAGLRYAMTTSSAAPLALRLGLVALPPTKARQESLPKPIAGGGQLIYTSGSTGRPKGVLHSINQLDASARMLVAATRASRDDFQLSILPLPLLLETISSICVPLLAGARTVFDPFAVLKLMEGNTDAIADSFERHRPTTSVLVPEMLSAWISVLGRKTAKAPSSLRFVAVGGAPVSAQLAEEAWSIGIPVHEGYGLSECCSVVALNRPGQRKAGTVGRPLDGLKVQIIDGEIVVDGPTLMNGYLNGPAAARPWRTGDLGSIDVDGNLLVDGRKDNLLVTSYGRNVSPEWIESLLLTDRRIAACAVIGHGQPHLSAILIASEAGAAWLREAPAAHVLLAMAQACRDAPIYAVPTDFVVASRDEALKRGVLTPNGRFRRGDLPAFFQELSSGRLEKAFHASEQQEMIA
ncbi:MAG: AMP-binding protein [Hyphomicrobium sp.]